ncbi:MAG: mechanosensitive ion channel family protein [Fidelibacterota bacterium]
MDVKTFLGTTGEWMMTTGARLLIILVLTLIALKMARVLSNRLFKVVMKARIETEMRKRAETLRSLVRYVLGITILAIALIMVLGEFGVKIGPILAAAGIVGVAIGFGAQHLVQDIISGFFILIEDQIRVGDVIRTAGKAGLVEKMNLRMTVLRDLSGSVHYIRNGLIDVVTNMTKEFSYYVFEIGVAYRENVDEVTAVIQEVDEELRQDSDFKDLILEPIEVLGLDRFDDSAVIIKARVKTVPIKQWTVGREFNRRLKEKFDERKIEIPFPHVTLYMGQDKDGSAAPLYTSQIPNE